VGITGGHKLLDDFRHFFTHQMFGDEEKDGNTEVCFSGFYFLKSQWYCISRICINYMY
jgi:hypothetical protein